MAVCITKNELLLAEQLRAECYVSGREKNPQKSAKIIHKLALEYKSRSPNKVSLIRSAALLNAAIVRKPDNEKEVLHDLQSLCSTILREAKAKNLYADLTGVAKNVKQQVNEMRADAKKKLDAIECIPLSAEGEKLKELEVRKISQIMELEADIAEKYTLIMLKTSQACCEILGEPPQNVKFALTGMGSLARKEISPFSDFENVIVLAEETKQLSEEIYQEVLTYFRWFAVVFQVILINLGETILPSVAIPSLINRHKPSESWFYDAYTKCGISFDGMMPHACKMPLGRQEFTETKNFNTELIKPVSDMLHYLSTEEDLKNGYNLADILTKTCFVAGSESVYHQFHEGAKRTLDEQRKNNERFLSQLEIQLTKDRVKFKVDDKIRPMYTKNVNIKSLMYRSVTIFISALGKLYGFDAASSFEIIKILAQKEMIDDEDRHKLSYAVAVGCEIRLKFHEAMQCQCDSLHVKFFLDKEYRKIAREIGGKSIIDFILIAQHFQKSLTPLKVSSSVHKLNLNWPEDLETTAVLAYILGSLGLVFSSCKKYLKQMKEANNFEYETFNLALITIRLLDIFGMESEFISDMEKELKVRKKFPVDIDQADENVAYAIYRTGFVLKVGKKYEEALSQFRRQLSILMRISEDMTCDFRAASSFYNIGMCLKGQKKYEEAQQNLLKSANIRRNMAKEEDRDYDLAYNLYQLGQTERFCSDFSTAKACFEEALIIFKMISENEAIDPYVKACEEELSLCNSKSINPASTEVKNIQDY